MSDDVKADAEARIADWEAGARYAECEDPKSVKANPDGTHALGYFLVRAEVDTAVALMRSLAAVASKAQAEVERLRADAEQLRADVARTDDKIGAMEIHGNSADYWYRKALARGKANEDLRAKLAEAEAATKFQPLNDWHEDDGTALFSAMPINEPPYCGTPLDDDWPFGPLAHVAMREACRRIAVRRMTSWTKDDDKRSQDFREGIEQAASDIACAISSLAPPDLDKLLASAKG